jgi:hypothetical protein
MVRNTKKRGGMLQAIGRPLGKAVVTLGEEIGKDYLRKKSRKVTEGIYDNPSLSKNPGFLLTGIKPISNPNIQISSNENINPNSGGRTRRTRRTRRNKGRKSRKNRK